MEGRLSITIENNSFVLESGEIETVDYYFTDEGKVDFIFFHTVTEYTPSYDTCKAYWLDMSNAGEFVFDGELFVFTFKIKETAPDGKYPVTIAKTDIGSWDVVTRVPECIGGEICVGDEKPSAQKEASADKFTLTVESVNGKPGDVVEVALNMKNNPGFCGFVIDIQYDKNALEIEEARGGVDFDKAVNFIS